MATYKMVNADQLDSDLALVADSIRSKGGTSGQLAFPGGFQSAIDAISIGATVQKQTGTVTTNNSGAASATVGFKPDLVAFDFGATTNGTNYSAVMFSEAGTSTLVIVVPPPNTSYVTSTMTVTQNNSGFSLTAKRLNTSFSQSNDTNRRISYLAMKYT